MCIFLYIHIYIYTFTYLYTYTRVTYIYIHIFTTQEERLRRPAMTRLRSSVQSQKAMTT